ncbi:RHS repeat-associated core domain-containing protein [Silvibacterium dinghuense]|nr:RHS repeat-associated core domain-containing protein [Silvibacterium dinghuense]
MSYLSGDRFRNTLQSVVFVVAVFMMVYACRSADAQTPNTGMTNIINTPQTPIPGVGHDYLHLLNETVNPADGTVSINIAIPVTASRGYTLPFSIQYSSSNSTHFVPGLDASTNSYPYGWSTNGGFMSNAGWSYSLPAFGFALGQQYAGQTQEGNDEGGTASYCYYTSNYVFRAPDGSSHLMYLDTVTEQSVPSGHVCSSENWSPLLNASDSAYQATMPTTQEYVASTTGGNSLIATVSSADGTIYKYNAYNLHQNGPSTAWAALPATIEDRNGNITTFNDALTQCGYSSCAGSLSITDSAGRPTLKINGFGTNGNTIAVGGFSQDFTVNWNAAPAQTLEYPVDIKSAGNNPSGCASNNASSTDYPSLGAGISSIELPNGKSYSFTYDSTYGYVSQITFPTGGYVKYSYQTYPAQVLDGYTDTWISNGSQTSQSCNYIYGQARVSTRTVSYDGVNIALVQTFSYAEPNYPSNTAGPWTSRQTTVTTQDLVNGTSNSTVYTYSSMGAPSPALETQDPAYHQIPVENTVAYYSGTNTSGTPLLTITKGWNDPYTEACELQQLPNGSISGHFYTWQAEGVLADDKEYDYGQITSTSACANLAKAPSGVTPTRETALSFQAFRANPLFYQPYVSNYTTYTLIDRPCQKNVYQAGTLLSQTSYLYDGGSSACGTAGSGGTAAISGLPSGTHDETNFGSSSSSSRGNITASIQQCLSGCTVSPQTSMSYDETGQIASVTDPCGNASCSNSPAASSHTTNYGYTDEPSGANSYGNSNAYLTSIIAPSVYSAGHSQSFQYNYETGALVQATDENLHSTSYAYNDPLNRLTAVTGPADPNNGNQSSKTSYAYDDTPSNGTGTSPSIETTVLLNAAGQTKTTEAIEDGAGHTIHSLILNDPSGGTDTVDYTYDGSGHVYQETNPYRSTSDSTYGTTKFLYDSLGRLSSQTQPDGSTKQWCYNDVASVGSSNYCSASITSSLHSWVDYTDESGNHWQRQSDGLGRLSSVIEPGGTSGYETDYAYDANDNLTQASQWGGIHFVCVSNPDRPSPGCGSSTTARISNFTYDSLSRLISGSNPERGSWSYSYASGSSLCSGDQSAPCSFTNANGNSLIYNYDALSRVTSKTYCETDLVGSCPSSRADRFGYDGLDESGNTLVPAVSNAIGRLSHDSNESNAANSYSYDVLGHIVLKSSCIPGDCVTGKYDINVQAMYDLAGDRTYISNGVTSTGIGLTYGYDTVGRVSSITSTWDDSAHPETMFSATGSGAYTAFGELQAANIGLNNSTQVPVIQYGRTYDNRERVIHETDIVNTNGSTTTSTNFNWATPQYYPNGLLETWNDSLMGNGWTFQYDALGRLTNANASSTGVYEGVNLAWAYDAWGNRTSETVTGSSALPIPTSTSAVFNTSNRITSFSGATTQPVTFSYDSAGNLTQDVQNRYLYDGQGRLCAVSSSSGITEYIYDPEGNRVAKGTASSFNCEFSANGFSVTNRYVIGLDNEQLSEMDGSGNWLHTNVFEDGQLLATYKGSSTYFAMKNWLGTKRMLVDENGLNGSSYNSFPYGNVLFFGWAGVDPSELHFTGKERDTESGNDFFGARYYSSSLGRFLSPDWSATPTAVPYADLTDPQSLNLYGYMRNNPLGGVDPDGHCCFEDTLINLTTSFVASHPAVFAKINTAMKAAWPTKAEIAAGFPAALAGADNQLRVENAEGEDASDDESTEAGDAAQDSALSGNSSSSFDQAREAAFKHAGMADGNVKFTRADPATGTITEFKGDDGAEVGYDGPHPGVPGPSHDQNHISAQTPGKRGSGGTSRRNFPYSGGQHPSRVGPPNKDNDVVQPH